MTTASKVTITADCMVKGATVKTGAKGNYLEVEVLRTGNRWPETFRCWDVEELRYLTKMPNTTHRLILERGNVKNDKEDDQNFNSYWWNLVGEDDMDDTPPPGTSRQAAQPAPAPTSRKAAAPTREDDTTRRLSIERQVAFKAVIDLIVAGKLGFAASSPGLVAIDRWTNNFAAILSGNYVEEILEDAPQSTHSPEKALTYTETLEQDAEHYCAEHQVWFEYVTQKRTGKSRWIHKLNDGSYCMEPVKGE